MNALTRRIWLTVENIAKYIENHPPDENKQAIAAGLNTSRDIVINVSTINPATVHLTWRTSHTMSIP
jgi:hypothetical protein